MATDNNNKVLNVPNLRFPEFTEEWRKYKVSDVLDFYSTNSLSWEQLDYNNEDLYNLHYGLIHVGLPILVDIGQNKLPGIKTECKPKNFELCKEGDVAFADASEDTNDVAKAIEFVNLNNHKTVCGLHTIHGRDNKHLTVLGYEGYAFASPLFHNQIRRIAQGTKIYSISSKNFAECYIGIPSKDEQSKIARLLALIDSRIATQNKIIEQLQSLIKGIVVLITAETPNARIDKCLVCHSSTLQENNIEDFGDFPVYGANGICGYTVNADFNEPAILIVKDGSGVGNVRFVNGRYSVIGTQNILTPQNEICLKYIFYCLQAFNFVPYKTGMAIPHIYFKDYGKAKIYCPNFEQQVKIASQIDLIESKIEIATQLLNKYEEQKKFLLSNMFI